MATDRLQNQRKPAVRRPGVVATSLRILSLAMLTCGVVLMSINLFGLSQPLRKPDLQNADVTELRFVPESVWSYRQSMAAIEALSSESGVPAYAEVANQVVHRSLVHVDWNRVNPEAYRQLIPLWENYFLYALGKYSGLPQFERYHFADYRRNIRRGIGICGDASTALSSVLDLRGIENRIVSFEGHVIVEYEDDEGRYRLLDPDFGVVLGVSLPELLEDPNTVKSRYLSAGYSEAEVAYLFDTYRGGFRVFDDTYHFMSKRYLFEYASYVAKWAMPFLLLLAGWLLLRRYAGARRTDTKDNAL